MADNWWSAYEGGDSDKWWAPFEGKGSHDWKETGKYVVNQLGRGVADVAGLAGDAASSPLANPIGAITDLVRQLTADPKAAQATVQHAVDPRKVLTEPGPVSKRVQDMYNRYAGNPEAQDVIDRYLGAAARGAGNAVLPVGGGAKGAISMLLGGVGGQVGAEVGHDIAPNSDMAPLVGMAVGGLAGGIPHGVESFRTGRTIRAGMQHPEWQAVNDIIVNDLEGGGTLEHPKTSKKGAMGPQQVMPETARDPGFGIRPWNGKTQEDLARVGRQYSAALLGKYKDPAKALAAYNAGPGRLDAALKHGDNWFSHLPEETQAYVSKGMDKLYGAGPGRGSVGGPVPPMEPSEIARAMGDEDAAPSMEAPDEIAGGEFSDNLYSDARDRFPANDGFDYSQMSDEELGQQTPEDNIADISDRFVDPEVRSFHKDLMSEVNDRAEQAKERGQQYHRTGKLPYQIGDEFTTPKSRDNPWRVTGHYVDPKNPDRYGYYVERGAGEDLERQQMLVSDPAADARMLKHDPNWDREAHVAEWENLSRPKNNVKSFDDARRARYEKQMEENNRNLKAKDNEYLDSLQERYDDLSKLVDDHLEGYPSLTPKELGAVFHSWMVLEDRMGRSKLPALGHDIVKKATAKIEHYMEQTKLAEAEADKPTPEQPYSSKDYSAPSPVRKEGFEANENTIGSVGGEPPREPPSGGGGEGRGPDPEYEGLSPEDKLLKALNEAKPVSREQKRAYHEERQARVAKLIQTQDRMSGEAGYYTELSQLKGSLPKVDYESVRHNFSQDDVDHLLDRVRTNNWLTPLEKVSARTGLMKLLGSEGTTVPTTSEIKLLSHIFPEELITALRKNRPFMEKFWEHVTNGLNVPRSLMASFDLSAPFRQGVFVVGRGEFWKAFATMFKVFGSERAYRALQEDIMSRPTYHLMRRAGLAITDADSHFLSDREEAFMSNWAERIPIIGRGVKASDRAYTGFLNKVRADVFDSLVKLSNEANISLEHNGKALKDIGKFVNAATGRGSLGRLNQAAPLLSNMFFSPRLIASRVQMLNPYFYATLSPVVRKEAVKSLLTFSALATTVLGLAAAGGAEVSANPTSSDFGKIKVGNTRYDILGGFQQYLRFGAQLIKGETTTASGKTKSLTDNKYGSDTRLDIVEKFFENKFSPVASFIADALRGKNVVGEKFEVKSAVAQRFIPLVAQDVMDAYKEYGAKGLLTGVPGVFGVGVQTYTPKPSKQDAKDAEALMKPFTTKRTRSTNKNWWKEYEQ